MMAAVTGFAPASKALRECSFMNFLPLPIPSIGIVAATTIALLQATQRQALTSAAQKGHCALASALAEPLSVSARM